MCKQHRDIGQQDLCLTANYLFSGMPLCPEKHRMDMYFFAMIRPSPRICTMATRYKRTGTCTFGGTRSVPIYQVPSHPFSGAMPHHYSISVCFPNPSLYLQTHGSKFLKSKQGQILSVSSFSIKSASVRPWIPCWSRFCPAKIQIVYFYMPSDVYPCRYTRTNFVSTWLSCFYVALPFFQWSLVLLDHLHPYAFTYIHNSPIQLYLTMHVHCNVTRHLRKMTKYTWNWV